MFSALRHQKLEIKMYRRGRDFLLVKFRFLVPFALVLSFATTPSVSQETEAEGQVAAPATEDTVATSETDVSGNATITSLLEGAERLGQGAAQIYRKDGTHMLVLDPAVFDRPLLWYSEAVSMPAEIISIGGNAIGETVVRLERRDTRVFVRDLIV